MILRNLKKIKRGSSFKWNGLLSLLRRFLREGQKSETITLDNICFSFLYLLSGTNHKPEFGRKNARTCFANSDVVRVFVPGLSILKVCLLEALSELAYRLQNANCLGRPGIESLPPGGLGSKSDNVKLFFSCPVPQ